MPRTSIQHPPKYSKHKATGRAYVTLHGRIHYLGKYGSAASRDAYESLVTQWVQGGGRYQPDSQQEITNAEVMVAYLAHAKRYYRKNGKQTREYGHAVEVCRAIKPLYGRSRAADFGPLALKTVRQTFVDDGIARKHINKQVDRVKRMYKWAAAEELISSEVPQALSMVPGLRIGRTEAPERAPVLPVGDVSIEATLEHLPSIVADMVKLQRLTGCRPEEVCSLRPCDLDRTGDVWVFRPESHKTEHHGRERVVFIGPKASCCDTLHAMPRRTASAPATAKPSAGRRDTRLARRRCRAATCLARIDDASRSVPPASTTLPTPTVEPFTAPATRRFPHRRAQPVTSCASGSQSTGGAPTVYAIASEPKYAASLGWRQRKLFSAIRKPT